MERDTFHRIEALATVVAEPYWRILHDAIDLYIAQKVPATERALLDANQKSRFSKCKTRGCNVANKAHWPD